MRIFGRGDSGRPAALDAASAEASAATNPRLERLVAKARGVLLFERLWRLLAPPLTLLGLFVCISWTGLWLETPHWARALGAGALALGLCASLLPLRRFRWPSRREALARIDRVSGLSERPAEVLDDRLGNGAEDAGTLALWTLHRRRAEAAVGALRTGSPSPRIVDVDRYALRAAVLVGLVATAFLAGPERYARLAAAFDWRLAGLAGAERRIDAWVDPPAYTGRTPIVLTQKAGAAQKIEAPTGSIVVLRGSSGKPDFTASGALAEPAADAPKDAAPAAKPGEAVRAPAPKEASNNEARLVLKGDAKLSIAAIGAFEFTAIEDSPPTIALTDPPKGNARGTLALKYAVADDYGAISAEAAFANPVLPGGAPAKRSLVDAPKAPLQLPPAGSEDGAAETTLDLSDHPWAGARVQMTLAARDEGGNEGRSEPVTVTLPQKPFVKPLARALVEQRRNLILDPERKGRVSTALDALMIEPDAFGVSAGVYLGLRVAAERLAAASRDADLVDVADHLWQMALRIENGDLSDAERDLRAAQQQMREALQRNAPPEELKQLAENLRAAMDKFLREFAEQQRKEMDQADRGTERSQGRSKAISQKELQAMLEKMQEMARNGDAAGAQKLLEQMQNILENLKMARPRGADPASREMSRALDELDQMTKQQQDLRDETHQAGQAAKRQQRREQRQREPQGEDSFGGPQPDDGEQDADAGAQAGQTPAPSGQTGAELQRRQQALRDRLEQLEKRLNQAGQRAPGLGEAKQAMRDAQKSLGEGAEGSEPAVDAQGRAVKALREGAQKLEQAMREQGEGQPGEGQAEGEGEGGKGEGQGQQGQFGQNGSDPLGRPTGREHAFNPSAKYDPLGAPAAERAQRVLEELRRRLGEPSRPREETDYLERLLRRY